MPAGRSHHSTCELRPGHVGLNIIICHTDRSQDRSITSPPCCNWPHTTPLATTIRRSAQKALRYRCSIPRNQAPAAAPGREPQVKFAGIIKTSAYHIPHARACLPLFPPRPSHLSPAVALPGLLNHPSKHRPSTALRIQHSHGTPHRTARHRRRRAPCRALLTAGCGGRV